jgi:hypothetical protein
MKLNTFTTALFVGLIASIAFILIQPLFGMLTLTSRHADAYIKLGAYPETAALILSWVVHISVSIFYALVSTIVFNINNTWFVSTGQIIALGWLTTLTATPANEFVVKLITTLTLPDLGSLSALNTDIGAKFWLHILFFALVVLGISLLNKRSFNRNDFI